MHCLNVNGDRIVGWMVEEAQLLYKTVDSTIDRVVQYLQEDDLLVLPCDTIYGLSGRYATTFDKLCALKKTTGQHQFIVLATLEQAHQLCKVPPILEKHWPCALTVILENHEGGQSTAIRVPNDPFIQTILTKLGRPIYSTSVNDTGFAITNITDIIFTYKQKVQAIVIDPDRGRDTPSTLIDCTKVPYELVRCGAYDASTLLV